MLGLGSELCNKRWVRNFLECKEVFLEIKIDENSDV